VYDADSRAKKLMTTDGILVEQIKKEFGTLAYDSNGNLNRSYLGHAAFGDRERLIKLNSLVHPRVAHDYQEWLGVNVAQPYVIREAALLYEANVSNALGPIIVVYAPEAIRINRVLQRDPHRSEEDVRNIMRNQMRDEEKMRLANHIIQNDDRHLVIPQVLHLHREFLANR
jgi:dephospho-CoA kinase